MHPDKIIQLVEQQYNLPAGAIVQYNRRRRTAEARAVAVVLTRKHCDYSYPELGDIFNRDHSTLVAIKSSPALQRESAKRVIEDISGFLKRTGA